LKAHHKDDNPDAPALLGRFALMMTQGRPVNQFADKREVVAPPKQLKSQTSVQAANSDIIIDLKQAADLEIKGDLLPRIAKTSPGCQFTESEVHQTGFDSGQSRTTEHYLLRIASALDPAQQNFADDLARVLRIHQRSLTSGSGSGEGQ
jgi:hypothetical protein